MQTKFAASCMTSAMVLMCRAWGVVLFPAVAALADCVCSPRISAIRLSLILRRSCWCLAAFLSSSMPAPAPGLPAPRSQSTSTRLMPSSRAVLLSCTRFFFKRLRSAREQLRRSFPSSRVKNSSRLICAFPSRSSCTSNFWVSTDASGVTSSDTIVESSS